MNHLGTFAGNAGSDSVGLEWNLGFCIFNKFQVVLILLFPEEQGSC